MSRLLGLKVGVKYVSRTVGDALRQVLTATREQFIDIFDGDDTLEYEPASTGAVIITAGDEGAEKGAMVVRP